jgi:integration host factor subunit alpha
MTGKTITRVQLCDAVHRKTGLSRSECMAVVELVLQEIAEPLAKGENVKLSAFGTFMVRKKNQRIGRNPKTGTEVPISPRRVVVFKASPVLKQQVKGERSSTAAPAATAASQAEASAPSP